MRQYNSLAQPIDRAAYPLPGPTDIITFKYRAMVLATITTGLVLSIGGGAVLWPFLHFSLAAWLAGLAIVGGLCSIAGYLWATHWLLRHALPNLPHFPPPAVEVREVPAPPTRQSPDRIIFTNNPLAPPEPKPQPAPNILPPDTPKTRLLNGCREDDLLYVAEWMINTGDTTQRTWDGKAIPSGPCSKDYHSQLCTTLQDHLKVMEGFAPRHAGKMIADDIDTVRSQMNLVLRKRYR